jgi:hypothetical protein
MIYENSYLDMFNRIIFILALLSAYNIAAAFPIDSQERWNFQAFGGAHPSIESVLDDDAHIWFHDDQHGNFSATIDGRFALAGIYTEKFTGRKFIIGENGRLVGDPRVLE